MPVISWLRHLAARLNRTSVRPLPQRRSFRLRLEVLEDRLTPSGGLLDPTFGSGGVVTLPSTTDSGAPAVAVQPDGKVVVAGQVTRTTGYNSSISQSITLQRLNRDGSLDTTFNRTGSLTIQAGTSDSPDTVALQPDGKIVVGGGEVVKGGKNNITESLVARVNPNGTLDTTFGSKGIWVSGTASPGYVHKLAVLTDPLHPGTVTGIVAAVQGPPFEAVNLTAAGAPDQTFGSGGFAVLAGLAGVSTVAFSVAVSPTGEIYLAGVADVGTDVGCLAAVTPAGKLDTAFGAGAGYVVADPTGTHSSDFNDVAIQTLTVNGQPVSRIVVAGETSTSGLVEAFTLSGALDTTFGSGGAFTTAGTSSGYNPLFNSITLEADGSIVVGGYQLYTPGGGAHPPEMLVGHLTANGVADTSFGSDGTGLTVVQLGAQSRLYGLAIDPTDGGILACGLSVSPPNAQQAAVIRLTAP